MTVETKTEPLFDGREWTFDTLSRTYDAIEDVAFGDLGLDIYPNQLEIISASAVLTTVPPLSRL